MASVARKCTFCTTTLRLSASACATAGENSFRSATISRCCAVILVISSCILRMRASICSTVSSPSAPSGTATGALLLTVSIRSDPGRSSGPDSCAASGAPFASDGPSSRRTTRRGAALGCCAAPAPSGPPAPSAAAASTLLIRLKTPCPLVPSGAGCSRLNTPAPPASAVANQCASPERSLPSGERPGRGLRDRDRRRTRCGLSWRRCWSQSATLAAPSSPRAR
mmetsp:Transcript_32604/g.77345  ORF Transcript_32604/g.77345 Transcript_32604/m.77345 type:complete len:224 (-) Transcript_32604:688-1359(-)